jgi:hypothetical protein
MSYLAHSLDAINICKRRILLRTHDSSLTHFLLLNFGLIGLLHGCRGHQNTGIGYIVPLCMLAVIALIPVSAASYYL